MRRFEESPNLSHEIWRWTLNHSSSIGRRSHPAVVTLRGRLYVCGGFDGAERQKNPGFDGHGMRSRWFISSQFDGMDQNINDFLGSKISQSFFFWKILALFCKKHEFHRILCQKTSLISVFALWSALIRSWGNGAVRGPCGSTLETMEKNDLKQTSVLDRGHEITSFGGIKHYKCMVILRDLLYCMWLGW